MDDHDFREIERDRDDRLADEAGEASSAAAAGRLTLTLPEVDAVVLTESGEAKRFGDWTADDLAAALARLRREVEERG